MTEQSPKPQREWWQHPAVIIVGIVAVVIVVIYMVERSDDRRDALETRQMFEEIMND